STQLDTRVSNIVIERNFLEYLSHPLITELCFSFQDNQFAYIVTPFYSAGDLRRAIKNRKWTEEEARPVIAEVVSALDYIHALNITHRDLKPENILMDEMGHIALADFDLAVYHLNMRPVYGIAGTEPYMAPEMIEGISYDCRIDYWSLGVILFELICGERPFRGKNRRELIKIGRYSIPARVCPSSHCRALMEGLLQVNPTKRLGYNDDQKLRLHPWFLGLDWGLVSQKKIVAVYKPGLEPKKEKCDIQKAELLSQEETCQLDRFVVL
ncbi:kinase-like domain-containing protein, partial [Gorgonomyces haynaldii]